MNKTRYLLDMMRLASYLATHPEDRDDDAVRIFDLAHEHGVSPNMVQEHLACGIRRIFR